METESFILYNISSMHIGNILHLHGDIHVFNDQYL